MKTWNTALAGSDIENDLREVGHALDRADEDMLYVLLVLMDPSRTKAVGLMKQKGPAELIGRITFPGGKLEQGESLEAASTREADEETGVYVPVENWRFVSRNAVVAVFAAEVPLEQLLTAHTKEGEPVFVFDIESQMSFRRKRPDVFAYDFGAIVRAAAITLNSI